MIAWGKRVTEGFRAGVVAMCGEGRLHFDPSWAMTCMAWETSRFKAAYRYGPDGAIVAEAGKDFPWGENAFDGGGGLVGFTGRDVRTGKPIPFHVAFPAIAAKTPEAQLADVEHYFANWIAKVGHPQSVVDCYLLVRGPYGVGKSDAYLLGGGQTVGSVRRIIEAFHAEGMSEKELG